MSCILIYIVQYVVYTNVYIIQFCSAHKYILIVEICKVNIWKTVYIPVFVLKNLI